MERAPSRSSARTTGHSRWSYACSKLTDEFLALACAREKMLPVIIARLFNTVGPRQTGRYGMVLPRFIAAAKHNALLKVFGDGRQTRCFCQVGDAVEALVRLQKSGCAALVEKRKGDGASPPPFGEIFNIGGTEEVSILELAKLVVKTLGSKSKIELIPYDQAYAPGFDDMRRRKPLVKKLESFVKFRPQTPLREIIRLTAGKLNRERIPPGGGLQAASTSEFPEAKCLVAGLQTLKQRERRARSSMPSGKNSKEARAAGRRR